MDQSASAAPVKRGRGRPRKQLQTTESSRHNETNGLPSPNTTTADTLITKRGRGRPRKNTPSAPKLVREMMAQSGVGCLGATSKDRISFLNRNHARKSKMVAAEELVDKSCWSCNPVSANHQVQRLENPADNTTYRALEDVEPGKPASAQQKADPILAGTSSSRENHPDVLKATGIRSVSEPDQSSGDSTTLSEHESKLGAFDSPTEVVADAVEFFSTCAIGLDDEAISKLDEMKRVFDEQAAREQMGRCIKSSR